MIKFKCLCCEHEQEFRDAQEAFQAGWDVAPYFTCQPLCDLCPAGSVVIDGLEQAKCRHAESHERWKRDGRPADFEWQQEQKLNEPKGKIQ